MSPVALLNIKKGEEIASALVSSIIPGTGKYKFLAKKKRDGKFEWVHFAERDNGLKENVCRGETDNEEQLNVVIDIMNRNLAKIFGVLAEMKPGQPEFRSLFGNTLDDSVN
jgi:hypothetical protein